MAKTLTIVAQRPPEHPGSDDGPIAAVWAKLSPLDGADHVVRRASTLRQAKKLLTDHKLDAADRLQLVGHGAPGKLWLSGSWTGAETSGAQGQVYVLDSNPNFYGILSKDVPAGCRVSLIGCTVGAASVMSRIADGPTLLFDLARMWDCDVVASTGYVDAEDFDDHGVFVEVDNAGQSRVRVASSKQLRISGEEADVGPLDSVIRPISPGARRKPTSIGFTRVVGLPMLGPSGYFKPRSPVRLPPGPSRRRHRSDSGVDLRPLESLVGREVDASSLLAAPELRLAVTVDGQDAEGEIIGNARLLRVRTATDVRHFELEPTSAGRQTMLAVLRAVVETFEPSIDDH